MMCWPRSMASLPKYADTGRPSIPPERLRPDRAPQEVCRERVQGETRPVTRVARSGAGPTIGCWCWEGARTLKPPIWGFHPRPGVTGTRGSQRGSRDALPSLATLTTQAAAVAFLLANKAPARVRAGGSFLPDGATGKLGVGRSL